MGIYKVMSGGERLKMLGLCVFLLIVAGLTSSASFEGAQTITVVTGLMGVVGIIGSLIGLLKV